MVRCDALTVAALKFLIWTVATSAAAPLSLIIPVQHVTPAQRQSSEQVWQWFEPGHQSRSAPSDKIW